MNFPNQIETERLRLRPPQLTDAETIFNSYAQDLEVTRYLRWSPHKNISETVGYLQRTMEAREQGSSLPYAIELKENGDFVGVIEIRFDDFKANVGYVIARKHWGKGFTAEALRALIELAMARPEIYRVWAVCDVQNTASARVMEKAGMQREGILRRYILHPNVSSEPGDCFCYAITK
jgi:[ribosomal protein S5]-alanine N-acetyltransferase